MITKVIMERVLDGSIIRQESSSGYYCANDIVTVGNKFRLEKGLPIFTLSSWLSNKSTIEFINELKNQNPNEEILRSSKGRKGTTWMHPFLFLDLALSINPTFKVEVYSWIFDQLIKYRNDSGDSFKRMTGALWEVNSNKYDFKKMITKISMTIKEEVGVECWEKATESQLKYRDTIHDSIATLADIIRDIDLLVETGILKSKKKLGITGVIDVRSN